MNKNRVSFINRILAFLLSALAALTLLISHFTFPVELILFNNQSYSPVIENEEFNERYPEIISDILTGQFYTLKIVGALPEILSNQDAFRNTLKSFIPDEWSKTTFTAFVDQMLKFLNFQIPTHSMNIELGELKSELILNSKGITGKYISSLSNCSSQSLSSLEDGASVFELPPCKPGQSEMSKFVDPTSVYVEDLFNRLPSKLSTSNIAAIDDSTTNVYFYYFSIARWVLRLMPLLTITLLILIAVALRNQRDLMLRWVGRLLVVTSATALVGLVIVLIGFDQLVSMLINQFLGNLIEGFGVLLLGFIQEIGYQTLVWVVISIIATVAFGLFLTLMAKLFKPKPEDSQISEPQEQDLFSDLIEEESLPQKEIIPQTIEEIEDEENNNKSKKKK